MTDNVIGFRPSIVGDGTKIDCDQVLENNKGEFVRLVLVGVKPDGDYAVAGTDSAAESLMLLQWASHFLVNNEVAR